MARSPTARSRDRANVLVVSGVNMRCRMVRECDGVRRANTGRVALTLAVDRSCTDDQGGRLKAEALAAARWQHDETVAPVQHRADRFALQRSEVGEAPDPVQNVAQLSVVRADYDVLE